MTAADPMISVRNVGKSFGTFRAIEDLSLDIAPGEFFTLLGASGCGNTTLLRVRSSQIRVSWHLPMGLRLVAPISRTLQPLPCSCRI